VHFGELEAQGHELAHRRLERQPLPHGGSPAQRISQRVRGEA
jgi:hypothetical protein